MDYLFCVVTDCETAAHPYETQFFLFSGADPDSVRGTNYEEIYPLGAVVSVADNESQREVMRAAVQKERAGQQSGSDGKQSAGHLAAAGNYVDYYVYLDMIDDHAVLLGMTYDLSDLKANIRTQTRRGTGYAIGLEILLLAIIIRHLILSVIRPLKGVQENIRLYKDTKDSGTVTQNLSAILSGRKAGAIRSNEIGELSEDIIQLAEEVDDYIRKIEAITAEKERLGTELSLAARIQESMLPDTFPAFPHRREFDVYAVMDPAKEVGGDFYDFFLIDEDHLCLVIADVSGKGIPAALFMMISKVILQSCAMLGRSPEDILAKTNEAICSRNKTDMFVTVWLGILEISTGKLTAANAGHEYPFLKKNGRFELFRDRHGFVVGGLDTSKYREYTVQLEPGDAVFVYTDGVAEANDPRQNLFGLERLTEALNRQPDAACQQQIANVKEAVDAFVRDAPQFDDLTMLCMQYNGPA